MPFRYIHNLMHMILIIGLGNILMCCRIASKDIQIEIDASGRLIVVDASDASSGRFRQGRL